MTKIDKKRSIGEVAKELALPVHVIRFWEEQFSQIKPVIGKGNRRYFFDKQIQIIKKIKYFLYEEGYTIKGLKKMLKNNGGIIDESVSVKNKITDHGNKTGKSHSKLLEGISFELNDAIEQFRKYLKSISQ